MHSLSDSPRPRRAVYAYAALCALAGLSGLMLSLTAYPGATVHYFEQAATDQTEPYTAALRLTDAR